MAINDGDIQLWIANGADGTVRENVDIINGSYTDKFNSLGSFNVSFNTESLHADISSLVGGLPMQAFITSTETDQDPVCLFSGWIINSIENDTGLVTAAGVSSEWLLNKRFMSVTRAYSATTEQYILRDILSDILTADKPDNWKIPTTTEIPNGGTLRDVVWKPQDRISWLSIINHLRSLNSGVAVHFDNAYKAASGGNPDYIEVVPVLKDFNGTYNDKVKFAADMNVTRWDLEADFSRKITEVRGYRANGAATEVSTLAEVSPDLKLIDTVDFQDARNKTELDNLTTRYYSQANAYDFKANIDFQPFHDHCRIDRWEVGDHMAFQTRRRDPYYMRCVSRTVSFNNGSWSATAELVNSGTWGVSAP